MESIRKVPYLVPPSLIKERKACGMGGNVLGSDFVKSFSL
jgi:hypothetical protein